VQNVVTYSTVISVPNDELKLKPGMTANVTIEIARKNNVLRVPNAALRFRPTNDIFAALKQEVPPEMQRGFGRSGQGAPGGQPGQQRGAGFSGASGQQGAARPEGAAPPQTAPPSAQQQAPGRSSAAPQTGSGRGREGAADATRAPQGAESTDRPRGERGDGRRGFGNMTPEEREARRKQFEERLKNMTPEERAAFEERRRNREGRGGGPGGGQPAEAGRGGGSREGGQQRAASQDRGSRGGQQRATQETQSGSRLANTSATSIDALFAPLPPVEGRGRVWMFINKQLKSVGIRTGITDGTWTEVLEAPDTAQLQPGTEVVTNVVTGLEPSQRPGQQGPGNNPLMPQRGGPGQRGGQGGGGGRGR
jgi:hypothetical protein